ncbi:MAG: hypothetical protein PHF44_00890 [Candidatus Pacebacteria bacterium]|nr:hypothetical protein [Candidatus Paceibacterota bacterium]
MATEILKGLNNTKAILSDGEKRKIRETISRTTVTSNNPCDLKKMPVILIKLLQNDKMIECRGKCTKGYYDGFPINMYILSSTDIESIGKLIPFKMSEVVSVSICE